MNSHTTGTETAGRATDRQDSASASASAPGDEPPPALVAREQAALDRVRTVSDVLDEAIRIPGTNVRVGLDPILGIVPLAGDALATMFALYPILEAARFGAPRRTLATMALLVAIDSVIGSIPVLGTVFDALWKANTWNARLLERHLGRE